MIQRHVDGQQRCDTNRAVLWKDAHCYLFAPTYFVAIYNRHSHCDIRWFHASAPRRFSSRAPSVSDLRTAIELCGGGKGGRRDSATLQRTHDGLCLNGPQPHRYVPFIRQVRVRRGRVPYSTHSDVGKNRKPRRCSGQKRQQQTTSHSHPTFGPEYSAGLSRVGPSTA